ncbi:nucleotidyl transferase AbiEii/AbiGii toxin family protein [Promicromonospora sp. AC04]|uniref:nucleotidyl transferase AbiEii/AbiGii toxin family protein n=1 Tax=Promicromonospora sp. AC04 TaxID=2135723 RepID=UPI000D3AE650|nr:nucleotidyl transferase AbiEii/AbiGii toxin family protein [Promicromonospora sp. AC04]
MYTGTPSSVRSLEQRIRNLEGDDGLAQRRRVSMALVVVGQMLPEGVVEGGSAMALRYGRGTRFTKDLDAARVQTLARFRSDFEKSLADGWVGFTGRLVEKAAPRPPAVPTAYVMQPFEVKLDYRGRPWCTVKFELGHNEIGDADEPEFQLADDLARLFTEVGLEAPKPVPVMRADHQVAQKLHAVSSEGSERARDLADLQLLDKGEDLDLGQVGATCVRLFDYRRQQAWPPQIVAGNRWDTLYVEAAEGLDVLPSVEEAAAWANDFVQRIAAASWVVAEDNDQPPVGAEVTP